MSFSPAAASPALTRSQIVAWRNAVLVIFAACGLAMASWVARVPAVRDALDASTQTMGLLIFGIAAGSIVGLLASSHIVSHFGTRTTIGASMLVGAIGFAVAGFGVSVVPSFAIVFGGLILFGASYSMCDVAMNVLGAANERVLGRSIMPIFHAFFSIGAMVGAGLGALAEAVEIPVVVHMLIIAVIIATSTNIAVRFAQSEHEVEEGAVPIAVDDPSKGWRARLAIWRDPRTILIGIIVLAMAFAEGSANDWLSLGMVDGHGSANAIGAVVYGIFVTSMTVARLSGVRLLDRFGRVPILRGSAALACVGVLLFIVAPNDALAIVGVVLWGLGAALGFPVGMSAAADDPKTAAARVSAVATIGYAAFLIGPPAIGFLGQHFGILHALLVVLVLMVIGGLASGAARKPESVVPTR
jgi:MFS family permease